MIDMTELSAMPAHRQAPPASGDRSAGAAAGLDKAFVLLKAVRAYKLERFPFLRTQVDMDLVLFIGHGQTAGQPMNLTDILTSNIGTVSTIVRRLGRLEKLGVVRKRKASADKRNVHYFLAEPYLEALADFAAFLRHAGETGASRPSRSPARARRPARDG